MIVVLAVVVAASLSSSVPTELHVVFAGAARVMMLLLMIPFRGGAKTHREVVISSSMVNSGVGEEGRNREIVVSSSIVYAVVV